MSIPKPISTITLAVLAFFLAPISLGQVAKDGADARFYDDLLDHFVGKWEVTAVVYGQNFTADLEAEWVLSHQYLRIRQKSREVVPWLKVPFERIIYIGYNHRASRYIVYELSVHGGDVPFEPEGFAYAVRTGNELKIEYKNGAEVVAISRFSWDPASRSWHLQGRQVIAGKEQEPHADQKVVAAKRSPN